MEKGVVGVAAREADQANLQRDLSRRSGSGSLGSKPNSFAASVKTSTFLVAVAQGRPAYKR